MQFTKYLYSLINNFFKSRIFIISLGTLIVLMIISLIFPEISYARPGGGNSYSGGGSSGGSGGGGDGELFGLIIWILIDVLPPEVSIPLIIIVIIVYMIMQAKKKREYGRVTSTPPVEVRKQNVKSVEHRLLNLKSIDPNFSKTLFLDFAGLIYTKYYSWWGSKQFNNLSPFLQPNEIEKSKTAGNITTIEEIVIGSINISDFQNYGNINAITVDYDTNYTLVQNGKRTRYAVYERWLFNRNAGVLSHEPDKLQRISCPNCGASSDFTDAGQCNSCGTFINNGEMQWFVKTHSVLTQDILNTSGLTHYEPERGTNLPTVYNPGLESLGSIFTRKNGLDWNSWRITFTNDVVVPYFLKIYESWTNRKLENARNLITDRLFDSFTFWIDVYKRQGLVNKLDKISISNVQIADIETDKFYDSVTVRVFASCYDYVTDVQGRVVGGSNNNLRAYTEYWTFIRKSGVKKDSYDYSTCPSCGAAADKMGQAGICEYCGSKISNGDFSWVLSIITQDEVYIG